MRPYFKVYNAYEEGLAWVENVSFYIAQAGDLPMLKYAGTHGCPLHTQAADVAAECGHADCLRYLLEAGCSIPHRRSLSEVCQKGYLHCIQVINQYEAAWDEWNIGTAARYGHLDCVQFLHEHGCPWGIETCNDAAENGHLDILRTREWLSY